MKTFEDENMQKYLYENEAKSIMKKKRIGLEHTIYLNREEKIKVKLINIYVIVLGKCPPSIYHS